MERTPPRASSTKASSTLRKSLEPGFINWWDKSVSVTRRCFSWRDPCSTQRPPQLPRTVRKLLGAWRSCTSQFWKEPLNGVLTSCEGFNKNVIRRLLNPEL
jgi:hypothetical protein